MTIQLTCPSCQDSITAQDSDRGSSIKCSTCWANVLVPAAARATPVIKAKLIEPAAVPAPVPVAKAVAMPLRPTPKPAEAQPAKRRFRTREETEADDRDDDDDRPRKRRTVEPATAAKSGPGTMLALIAVGAVIVLGLVGGGIALFVGTFNKKDAIAEVPTTTGAPDVVVIPSASTAPRSVPKGDFDPNGLVDWNQRPQPEVKQGLNPPRVLPNTPPANSGGPPQPQQKPVHPALAKPIEQSWKAVENKDGFSVLAPPDAKKERHTVVLDQNRGIYSGQKYQVEDSDVIYHIFYHDVGGKAECDLKELATKLITAIHPHQLNGVDDVKVDGREGKRWEIRQFFGGLTSGVSVKVGYRVFTFFVTSREGILKEATRTLEERQDKFLKSVKISFDPKTHKPDADEAEWVSMAKTTGFSVLIPKQATSVTAHSAGFFDPVPGKVYKAEIDDITYEVFVHDVALQPKKRATDVVKDLLDKDKIVEGPTAAKLGTNAAEAYEMTNFFGQPYLLRTLISGQKVYSLRTSRKTDWNAKVGDKEYQDKSAKFFDSFRLADRDAPVKSK